MHHEVSDEARLMAKAAEGNHAAFDTIVRRHQNRLQRFATRMCGGDAGRGADVAVGAFVRLWETRAEYRPCGRLEAWLLRTAYRLCIDQIRRDRAAAIASDWADPVEAPDKRMERAALAAAVRDAVMELPETHRAVLLLSTYEGLSYEEISQALDVPPGTVASRRNHALKLLRRRLAAWEKQP